MIEWTAVTDACLLDLWRAGLALDQIGARYGVVESTVRSRLEAVGAIIQRPRRRNPILDALSDEEFRAALKEMPVARLARQLGVHRSTVQRRQKKLGIPSWPPLNPRCYR